MQSQIKMKKIIELSKQDALTKIGIEFFEPGRFITLKDGAVFYSKDRLGNNRFIEVFMQKEIDGEVSVVTAEYAEIQGDQGNNLLVFFNGQRYQGKPGDDDFRVLEFSEHQLPLFISKTKKEINNIPTNKKIILSIGRFSKKKGRKYLIDSFHLVNKKLKDTFLVIIGNGSEKQNIINLIKEKNKFIFINK